MFIKSIFTFAFMFLACEPTVMLSNLPYNINEPNQTLTLTAPLQEISGICLAADKKQFLTLQDENGTLFWLNKETGAIEKQVVFKPDGDFEDLTLVGETVYVLRSKGVISAIDNFADEKNFKVTVFEPSVLGKTADTEGLCYDAKNNRLLIACKGVTGDPNKRAIWSFDLRTKQYGSSAVFEIGLSDIQAYLKAQKADKEEFKKFFEANPTELPFGPSAIAIHPKTGNYYIASSVGKILIVTDEKGKIKSIDKLSKKIHTQPEGIVFDENATLYISNEGKKEDAPKIYSFLPK